MSKVLAVVATVASIAAIVPGPHQPIAQAIAVVASVGATLTAKQGKPAAQGSVNEVRIGANLPTPYAMGRTYVGGNRVLDAGYGGTVSGVDNPYRSMVDVWSLGPVEQVEAFQADFETVTFSVGNAVGYYANFLHLQTQRGLIPESAALEGPWGAIPGWSSAAKLSGLAAGIASLKFDKKGKVFVSGVPQFGAILKGVLAYDPRKDSTYPGGAGAHRWDDEASWEWTENPALHAIAYARGRYQNGKKVFGCGFPEDGVDLAPFVAWANVCDTNGWKIGGVIYEPGSRWDNLKRICEAGGAEPCFVGARLSVRYWAPKVALDTIEKDDLADGEYEVPAMRSWRDRKNKLVPRYRSADHKWEYIQAEAVSSSTYIDEDGEEKEEEYPLDLVQDVDQAAQLTAYRLVNLREYGPIVLPCKPRMIGYKIGEALLGGDTLEELGLAGQLLEITGRQVDPATGIVTLTLASETTDKHAFALGQTGVAPPTPSLTGGQGLDEIVAANVYRSTPHVVASEAEMVALNVAEGEVAIRTDIESTFIHNGGTSGTAADWTEAPSPAAPVSSVAGKIGAVTLVAEDVTDFPEAVRDRMGVTLVAGANVTISADDPGDTITIAASPGASYTDENAQDAVGGIFTDSASIDFTYDDGAPSITAVVKADSVDNTMLANMAEARIKGRATGAGTGDPTDLTAAQVKTLLALGTAADKNTGTSGDAVPLLNGSAATWTAGATFGGNVSANGAAGAVTSVRVVPDGASLGGARLERATGVGIVSFYNTAGARQGYLGFSATGSRLAMAAEGAAVGWGVTGDINVSVDYKVGGTKVVGARATGWGAPTGTATRTTFATSTVTLPELAERVKALTDDLTTHGLIGA